MVGKIKKYMEEICSFQSGDAVVVGVSGGADSVCLLCVLREIFAGTGVTLHAAHINHNLRAEAADDQKYVEALCGKWDIPCRCYSYDVKGYAVKQGISTEEAGRRLRYRAFYELRELILADKKADADGNKKADADGNKKADADGNKKADENVSVHVRIAVAHTMDDNAETMLLNLFRGTGLKGLCGIPVSRGDIIRPLLCVRRSEIEAWLTERGIEWRHDCTNDTDDYTRNKIRHQILPVAETQINENAVLHMNRAAGQLSLAEDYLAKQAEEAWEDSVRPLEGGCGVLILRDSLLALHPYLRKRVLLEAMQQTAGTARDIGAAHVEAVEDLFGRQCGRRLHLAYGMQAERTYEGVMIGKNASDGQDAGMGAVELKIPGSTRISGYGVFETRVFSLGNQKFCEFPKDRYTKWFDYDKIKSTVRIRTRQTGDYLAIDAEGNTQKLKSYLINQKIPAGERDKLLLVADGEHIMWIVGYRCSSGYYLDEDTKKVLEVRYGSE